MKHLIICREYPPGPEGGIGTYVFHISRLLAESGETVHVIGRLWEGAEKEVEEQCDGRLIIHRIPLDDWTSSPGSKPSPAIKSKKVRGLFESGFYPQCFSWQAGLLAESLVEQEGIDLIEAQEFEAPLYYFQLRRALGWGPKRCPPCIIHMHSPMEFIARYSEYDIGAPYFLTSKRLEDYSIAAADALLCPSRYLARQAEAHYGLAASSIRVIPLPIGDNPLVERDEDVWEHGTICYVGRLERRKGVLEWIDAAVAVAPEYPVARFEFIGANILDTDRMNGEECVQRRIPDNLRTMFLFRGPQRRSALPQSLARARIAVVPSRWENFPNTCIEAMCSGLPVIASPEGGMAEMVKDGRSGWLAADASSEGLAEALKRALETPTARIAEMGHNASADIRRMCDNQKIVESHLDFRSQIVNQGAKRSVHLPLSHLRAKRSPSNEPTGRTLQNGSREGLAIVVTCFNAGQSLDECLQSIEQQTREPVAVAVVHDGLAETQAPTTLSQARRKGWQVIHRGSGDLVVLKNAGIEAILGSGSNPLGFAFLGAEDRLRPGFVATCESVLQRCPEVGLVSCWAHHYSEDSEGIWIKSCPSFPYQWLANEAAPFSVVRTEALRGAGNFRPEMNRGYEDWDLFNAVMAEGWVAVTIPEVLADQRVGVDSRLYTTGTYGCRRMHREILERFPDLITRDIWEIVLLAESRAAQSLREKLSIPQDGYATTQTMPRRPQGIAQRILRKAKDKTLQNTPTWMYNLISRAFWALHASRAQ